MIWTVHTSAGPVTVREQLEPDDEPGVLALFAECADWFEATTGLPSGPSDVQSLFYALPDGASLDDKRLYLVLAADRVIGLVDVVLRYPDVRSAAIGAFLIAPSFRRQGVASAVAVELGDQAWSLGFERVTATVAADVEAGRAFAGALGAVVSPEPIRPGIHRAELTLPIEGTAG